MAPTDGDELVGTPWPRAFTSQSPALPFQVTLRLYAAHQVHWPNGNRSGNPPGGTHQNAGRCSSTTEWGAAEPAPAALPTTAGRERKRTTATSSFTRCAPAFR